MIRYFLEQTVQGLVLYILYENLVDREAEN